MSNNHAKFHQNFTTGLRVVSVQTDVCTDGQRLIFIHNLEPFVFRNTLFCKIQNVQIYMSVSCQNFFHPIFIDYCESTLIRGYQFLRLREETLDHGFFLICGFDSVYTSMRFLLFIGN